MKNTGNILGAFLLGAGIGAVIGILMAPGKGSDTRKKLISKAQKLAGDFKNKAYAIKDELEHPADLEHKNRQEFYDKAFS